MLKNKGTNNRSFSHAAMCCRMCLCMPEMKCVPRLL